jgi:MFS family permease
MTTALAPRATAAPAPQPTEPSGLALAVVLVGAYLAIVDFFIVNVALPSMGRDLHAGSAALELVVAGYATAYALTLVAGGRLGDAHGRRRLFSHGLVAFALTSLLCGLAPTATTLVIARVLQGFAAALLVPQVLATIQATTTGVRRARALGFFGATAGLAAATGQVFGGLLISANIAGSQWRPIFLVNVPIAFLARAVVKRIVPETFAPNPARPDVRGTVLLGVTVLAVMLPLTLGHELGWPVWLWVVLALAPVASLLWLRTEHRLELRGRVPLVPLSIIEHTSMRRGLVTIVPFFAGFSGFLFVYALGTQEVLRWSALHAGLGLLPLAVAFLGASLVTSRLLVRYGRRVMTVGASLQSLGLLGVVLVTASTWPHVSAVTLAAPFIVVGLGQGLVASPMFGVVLSEVPIASAGVGSGVLATTQQISLALGASVFGTTFLTVAGPTSAHAGFAFALMVGIDAVLAVGITLLSTRLPDPRYAAAPAPSAVVPASVVDASVADLDEINVKSAPETLTSSRSTGTTPGPVHRHSHHHAPTHADLGVPISEAPNLAIAEAS